MSKPLSPHALGVLRDLLEKPVPANDVNSGVIAKFIKEGLAEIVSMPSPYKTHKVGTRIGFLRITDKGRVALAS